MTATHAPYTAARSLPPRSPHDDAATRQILAQYVVTRDPRLREALAKRYDRVVQWLAGKFAHGRAPSEDLIQAGRIGLIEALDRFDPERGAQFLTYAISMIVGQIKHHFRDCSSGIRAPRLLQELSASLVRIEDELTMDLGRTPTLTELAEFAGVTEEQIVSAMELTNLYRPKSLNLIQMFEDWESNEERQDLLGQVDPRMDAVVEFDSLYMALDGLDERKHHIVQRRFFDQCTQREVARELGLSQMHVSRLEREALEEMRETLEEAEREDEAKLVTSE